MRQAGFKLKGRYDEPVMSDLTILVSVEDLINIAMGPAEGNTVNFKMIQTVLHILARQMRLLETKVDIKIADVGDLKPKKRRHTIAQSSESPSSDMSPKREHMDEIREEKSAADRKRSRKMTVGAKPGDEEEKIEKRKKSKDRDSDDEEKDKGKQKKLKKPTHDESDDEDVEGQIDMKTLKEIEAKLLEKMSPEEREAFKKQKEIEDKLMKKMSPKEKAQYLKQKEKELRDLQQMSPKEKEKYFKEKEKEQNALQNMSPKEREKHFKEAEQKLSKEKEIDREKKMLENMSPKEKELYLKQKEREEKALEKMSPKEKELYLKQKEREEKALEKMSPKEREKYLEEKEKECRALEKMSPKERQKYLQDKEKEAQALEKMSPKEKEQYFNEKKKRSTKATGSGTSIAITEVERQNEKVLVVEKGPTTRRSSKTRTGVIDVVTRSQFDLLEAQVERLQKAAGPLPMPSMPDDMKLKADLVKGSASLTDTMQAMQVSARVQAAEAGLARMAGLLTQLAASGILPESFAGQLAGIKAEMDVLKTDLTAERSLTSKEGPIPGRKSMAVSAMKPPRASVVMSQATRQSRASGRPIAVTRNEMDDAISLLRDDMTKTMQSMTYKAASSAETAAGTAKGISDKMELAMKLNSRISDLYALTSDYAEQLSGFDAGLNTQMQSFKEQMIQMRADLKGGLAVLESANNDAETAAVMELTERFTDLQTDIDGSLLEHQRLTTFQRQIDSELRGLVQAVEAMREQKADHDELSDGLRDKADLKQLGDLLTEEGFAQAQAELNRRLELCYDKFNKQEVAWMSALKDLNAVADDKAEILQLLSMKDDVQDQLTAMLKRLQQLAAQLGEPKAAILTRLLSKDGKCGACNVTALMESTDKVSKKPYPLPALRPPPDGMPCAPEAIVIVSENVDSKTHVCNRWVGGSHTLLPRSEPREMAPALIAPAHPVKKYTGSGADGRMYNLEMDLQPCVECNKLTADDEAGAGDMKVCDCIPRGEKCDCWLGVNK